MSTDTAQRAAGTARIDAPTGLQVADTVARVVGELNQAHTFADAGQRVVDGAIDLLGCADALVLLLPETGCPIVLAGSDRHLVAVAQSLNGEVGDGTLCAESRGGKDLRVPDLEQRNDPDLVRLRTQTPVRSIAGYALRLEEHGRAALLGCWHRPDAMTDDVYLLGRVFATHAAVALTAAAERDLSRQLHRALLSTRQLATAIGILMATQHVSDSAAFSRLRATAKRSGRTLAQVAEQVIASGGAPGPISADGPAPTVRAWGLR